MALSAPALARKERYALVFRLWQVAVAISATETLLGVEMVCENDGVFLGLRRSATAQGGGTEENDDDERDAVHGSLLAAKSSPKP
jgi:hypothetical protein